MPTIANQDVILTRTRSFPKIGHYPEAASQSFKSGRAILLLNSSGQVDLAAAAGANATDSVDIIGIPLEDASGTTNNLVPVLIFDADTEVRLPVEHATPASAVTARTLVGETYVLTNASADPKGWAIAIDTSTNGAAAITAIDPSFPIGEQHGYVWVRILDAARAFGG